MRPASLLMLLLTFAAGSAASQQLPVRSGDHPSFSRLTIAVPASQPWDARQNETGVTLTLPGFSGGFETEGIFARMRRDRVASVDTTPSTFSLSVVCDCIATAFRSGPLVVIDVADRGTRLAASPLPGPPLGAQTQSVPDTRQSPRVPSRAPFPWIGSTSPFALVQPESEGSELPVQAVRDAEHLERTVLLQQIQKDLMREVGKAASLGLLDENYEPPETVAAAIEKNSTRESPEPQPLPEAFGDASRNMRITTSMDAPLRTQSGTTASGIACPAADFPALETWGDESGFSTQIGPARNVLMNARDQLDTSAAIRLAQLYLYFGFGAEALDALRLAPALQQENPELVSIATILEYGAAAHPNAIGQFTDCPSDIALWASLSYRNLPSGTVIDTDAALRALNKLPRHLRQIAAPELSNRFLQYGAGDAAAAALRSVERLPGAVLPQTIMAQADLAIEAGDTAEGILREVIETNSPQSPQALVKLVEAKLANNEALSYETAALVEAYVQELRGTQLGRQLRRTQVIALSQSGHFDAAFAALDALSASLSPRERAELLQAVLQQLVQQATDIVFLEHVFEQDSMEIERLPTSSKLQLAARLLDLGFPAQVQTLLASITDMPRNSARQLLAARTALMLEQPFQAQAALIGIEDTEAALLRAQAKEMAGDYRAAAEIFSRNDAAAQATQAAWLAEDWRDLIGTDTPVLGSVAALGQSSLAADDAGLGPLGLADRALAESTAARDALEQLLADPMVQVTPDS